MKLPLRTASIALLTALTACDDTAAGGDSGEGAGPGGKADAFGDVEVVALSTSTVEALAGDVSSVRPSVQQFVLGSPLQASDYLRPMAVLGYYGPIGGYGPLGVLGPIGQDVWNPSTFVDLAAPWDGFSKQLTAVNGPLSEQGPLGVRGPLNPDNWSSFASSGVTGEFMAQLEPGGLFAPLGPLGPLGALGPLGPLGPVGAHGYATDDNGQYVSEGPCAHSNEAGVCRTATVGWDGQQTHTYGLFENYREDFAATMPDNDTSFMVTGIGSEAEPDTFEFVSGDEQFVTVLVMGQWTQYEFFTAMSLLAQSALTGYGLPTIVPGFVFPFNGYDHASSFDDYDLVLTIEDGQQQRITLGSDSGMFPEWIQVWVPRGARVTAEVVLASRWNAVWRVVPSEYRLFVVGSTPYFGSTRIAGAHQQVLRPN